MRLPLIIGFAGRKRSGKDTAGQRFVDVYGYTHRSFAKPLKDMAYDIDPIVDGTGGATLRQVVDQLGWEEAKDTYADLVRFLQRLGTDGVRNHFGEDAWVDLQRRQRPERETTVYTDVRFPNEVDFIHGKGGIVVRLIRPGQVVSNHVSETALDHLELPYVQNVGDVEELHYQVLRTIQYCLLAENTEIRLG